MADFTNIKVDVLRKFTEDIFIKLGVPEEDAKITVDVLLAANRRGINSHGVARLKRYVGYIKDNKMTPKTELSIIKETPVSILASANNGIGQVAGYKTMNMVINKAKENGLCFATVKESNHYGIAGYYSMMALKYDLLGISLTNSAPLVLPTFGKQAILGTNPLSIAAPTKNERPFVLDMATSTVPRGKLEVYNRMGKQIPDAWATDEKGNPSTDAAKILDNMLNRKGGGLLPLGGAMEEMGSHKGYGLSAMVDILSGVLSGGAFGSIIYSNKQAAGVCHFFGAINPDIFTSKDEFKENMDKFIGIMRDSEKAEGRDKIYIAGEKEFSKEDEQEETVSISNKVVENLKEIGNDVGIEVKF
ncbi:Ldh family oxidoreductase [candidate division WOR-3 bacterium]|nr:Ldh family oxidoreductase [candidate division WOR-3 bacterium]MCK4575240.1 Ldh family oxidoreductase [candidate division WOR-3 bacterium]